MSKSGAIPVICDSECVSQSRLLLPCAPPTGTSVALAGRDAVT